VFGRRNASQEKGFSAVKVEVLNVISEQVRNSVKQGMELLEMEKQ